MLNDKTLLKEFILNCLKEEYVNVKSGYSFYEIEQSYFGQLTNQKFKDDLEDVWKLHDRIKDKTGYLTVDDIDSVIKNLEELVDGISILLKRNVIYDLDINNELNEAIRYLNKAISCQTNFENCSVQIENALMMCHSTLELILSYELNK